MFDNEFRLYQKGDSFIWTDPYISQQLLKAHLDPDTDAASRRPATIDRTVSWLDSLLARASDVLDLGCGPGLYTSRLQQLGHRVVGVDISAGSLEYARSQRALDAVGPDYRQADYLNDQLDGCYDLVYMIYCDFGALLPEQQDIVLAKVKMVLKPGGRFVFDVFGPTFADGKEDGRIWHSSAGGDFWSQQPHLMLEEIRYFREQAVSGERHVLVQDGSIRQFVFWNHWYTEAALAGRLAGQGWKLTSVQKDLVAANDFAPSDVLFALCTPGNT